MLTGPTPSCIQTTDFSFQNVRKKRVFTGIFMHSIKADFQFQIVSEAGHLPFVTSMGNIINLFHVISETSPHCDVLEIQNSKPRNKAHAGTKMSTSERSDTELASLHQLPCTYNTSYNVALQTRLNKAGKCPSDMVSIIDYR